MYVKLEWKRAQYDRAGTRAYTTCVRKRRTSVEIVSSMSLSADTVQRMMDVNAVWVIDSSGGIHMSLQVHRNMEFPELPRFGLRLFLDQRYCRVSYCGMGPYESYADKHRASGYGLYHADVEELHEDYIRPQENGSHMDCDYVLLSDEEAGLAAVSEQVFPLTHLSIRRRSWRKRHTITNWNLPAVRFCAWTMPRTASGPTAAGR